MKELQGYQLSVENKTVKLTNLMSLPIFVQCVYVIYLASVYVPGNVHTVEC